MKRVLMLSVVAVFAWHGADAQDAKAKTVLEAAQKKMGNLKTLKSAFTLKLMGKNGKIVESKKGTFLMKGVKYHISIPGQEIISDGKTVWTYMKDAGEVQISNYNASEQSMSPAKLFTNFYDKEYKYRYLASRKVAGKTCDVVEMVPVTEKNSQFTKVELAIDKTGTIAGGNVFEKNGNQYQYEVSGVVPNAAIPESQFSYDPKAHPKVEVVDLR